MPTIKAQNPTGSTQLTYQDISKNSIRRNDPKNQFRFFSIEEESRIFASSISLISQLW